MRKLFSALLLATAACLGTFAFEGATANTVNVVRVPEPNGVTWTRRTPASLNQWRGVCYGNGLFVAVAGNGTGTRVMTSANGIVWTTRTSAADNVWYSVCYAKGLFVAVAATGTGTRIMTSPDGITWSSRTNPVDNSWRSVTYGIDSSGNGVFVAVSAGSSGGPIDNVMTSYDGITWTSRVGAADNSWQGVCYGNGLFVAVSSDGTANRVQTSPDGITWTSRDTTGKDNQWTGVCFGNGLFVAVAVSGTGNRVMTSPDGTNWTLRTSAADNSWGKVCYGNGLFVASSYSGNTTSIMKSSNGINWTTSATTAANSWQSICYGNGLFVTVSNAETSLEVMTSGQLNTYNTAINSALTLTDMSGAPVLKLNKNLDPSYSVTNMPGDDVWLKLRDGNGATNNGGSLHLLPGSPASTGFPGNVYFDANPWDDTMQPGTLTISGGSTPAVGQVGSSGLYLPVWQTGDSIIINVQFPHSYKEGTDVVFHVHYLVVGSNNGGNLEFTFTYQWVNIGGSFNPTASTTPTPVQVTPTNNVNNILTVATISGAGKGISSSIVGVLSRTTPTGTDVNGTTHVIFADAHFQKDAIGSRKETTK
jgi:hypothetical protein